MTFDTFDSYNTDEAYKDNGTTAKGLVAAYKKDNPEGTREDFYSKLNETWKKDKDGHVKEAVDEAFKVEEPKAETPAPTPVETPKVEETVTKKVEEEPEIKKADKNYMNDINAILNEEQRKELQKLSDSSVEAYNRTLDNIQRSGELFKKIDDHAVSALPTFMIKRYMDGEFGDLSTKEGKKEAKTRLAYFLLNSIQSKLKNASNAAALAAGRAPMFADTMSDYEKYQQTNFANAMENRWNKYKQDTQAAIDMVKQRDIEQEDALNIINKISMNNRLQNAYNMADANKKAYMIEVLSKIGDKVSNWNDAKFVDTLVGAEITGEDVGNAAALIGARAGERVLNNFNLFDENGNLDFSALKELIKIPGVKDQLDKYGIDVDKIDFNTAGVGGGEVPKSNVYDSKETGNKIKNPFGNLKGYKALDGNTYNFDTFATKEEKDNLAKISKDLSKKYYDGEIDAATYRKYLDPLVNEAKKHRGINVFDADTMIKKNIDLKLKNLNKATNDGSVTVDSYKEQTSAILDMAKDAGYSDKEIEKLKKDFKNTDKIKYKGPNKKK